MCLCRSLVITDKTFFAFRQYYPVAGGNGGSIACTGLLGQHLAVKAFLIEVHALLLENESRQVQRESVSIVECECLLAVDNGAFLGTRCRDVTFEHRDTLVKSTQECVLFFFDDAYDEVALGYKFGICITHDLYEGVHQAVHKGALLSQESVCIAHGTAQYAANDISGLGIGRQLRIGYGESDSTGMVGDDAHGDVHALVLAILVSGQLGNLVYQRSEYIRVII